MYKKTTTAVIAVLALLCLSFGCSLDGPIDELRARALEEWLEDGWSSGDPPLPPEIMRNIQINGFTSYNGFQFHVGLFQSDTGYYYSRDAKIDDFGNGNVMITIQSFHHDHYFDVKIVFQTTPFDIFLHKDLQQMTGDLILSYDDFIKQTNQ
ncbi:MAG: hypothetical protein LBU66_05975 [Treponema sp.]|nr:hypothetical protein [Treponema sp.]